MEGCYFLALMRRTGKSNISFVILVTIIPLVRSALMKDLALVSRVVCKVDFVFETLSAITVLVLFGVMLEDARVVICPILFWMWLDSRLSDAICVFYHSNHRGSQYRKSRVLTLVTALFTLIIVFSLLALQVVLIVQAIPNMDLFTRI